MISKNQKNRKIHIGKNKRKVSIEWSIKCECNDVDDSIINN